ncbi:hypothetical protein B0O99DRAFT_590525 [Bisporella sp. PMI_857]|nr:hypothetical protein B0O99DRAFT_590525 [Bisporella sp. PMI_857]
MAIDKVHQGRIVHYDISPSNLMLDNKGSIRVIDFGRAGYIGEDVPLCKYKGIMSPTNAVYSIGSDKNVLKETIKNLLKSLRTYEVSGSIFELQVPLRSDDGASSSSYHLIMDIAVTNYELAHESNSPQY